MRPPLLDESLVDAVVHVPEADTVRTCRELVRHGFLFGGSTGTVVTGALGWLSEQYGDGVGGVSDEVTAVTISPDLGERYMETIYHDEWVRNSVGSDGLAQGAGSARTAAEFAVGLETVSG